MSSMLEQAIVDAAALREAALKNAEQSLIEKFAPQIKEAVESLLEQDEDLEEDVPQPESELDEIPDASMTPEGEVEMSVDVFEFKPEDFNIDLSTLDAPPEPELEAPEMEPMSVDTEPGIDLEAPPEAPAGGGMEMSLQENDDKLIEELATMLEDFITEGEEEAEEEDEEEKLEEELTVDMGQAKTGTFETNEATLQYEQEKELARMESTKYKEENEALQSRLEALDENLKKSKKDNLKLSKAVVVLNGKLQESMLSNAKLVYSNQILGDASLNERQKKKIVEAIAKAKSVDEAKSLCETLKTTVGTSNQRGPKSLSESVQRRSTLSGILPRRKQEKPDELPFATRMQKLAGIK